MMTMVSTVYTSFIALLALSSGRSGAFTPPRVHPISGGKQTSCSSHLRMAPPKGSAAMPLDKKKIAIFGAGGYLGAVLFGFLQRAASLYGTGISPQSSPRLICATSGGAEALNRVLGPCFKLAFAGEDLVRLVDTSDAAHIKERLNGFDAAILGTTYQLEQRAVVLNTYEKTPNDKTFEFYLDEKYGAWENEVPSDDSDIHTTIFKNSVQACKEAGICHLIVMETPRTVRPSDFIDIREEEGLAYTYIRTAYPLKKDLTYTFEKGISSNKLGVVRLQNGSTLAPPLDAQKSENEPAVSREDFAALIVQCLMTLDWSESRILEVSPSPDSAISSGYGDKRNKRQKFDREWCPNSELFADILSAL